MQITIVGLKKMRLSLAKQLSNQKKTINGFGLNPEIADIYLNERLNYLQSIDELGSVEVQNVVYLLQPAGEPTEQTIDQPATLLNKDNIIIEFSNSFYRDSLENEELTDDTELSQFSNKVHTSGEAKWMIGKALQEEVPTPVISLSFMKRNASSSEASFSNQTLSSMRYNFGGIKNIE